MEKISICSSDKFRLIRNNVRYVNRARLRTEQDNISRQCKINPNKFWHYIKTKTKTSLSIGYISYVKEDGSESFAKTHEKRQIFFHNLY